MAVVAHPSRPQIRRNSPHSMSEGMRGFSADVPVLKRIDMDDSDSDDEPPPAIKFSKVTQALLDDAPVPSSPPQKQQQEQVYDVHRFNRSLGAGRAGMDTPSRAPGLRIIRKSSPALASDASRGPTPPRVVHVGMKGSESAAKRSASVSSAYAPRFPARREPTPTRDGMHDVLTPAPAPRALRVRTRANSAASQDGQAPLSSRSASRTGARSAVESDGEQNAAEAGRSTSANYVPETISRFGASTIGRNRNPVADSVPPPGSQRMKRAPISGSFLKSGPVRRGNRRRESEDNVSPNDDGLSGPAAGSLPPSGPNSTYTPQHQSTLENAGSRNRSGSMSARATSAEPVSAHDFANKSTASYESRPSSRQAGAYPPRSQMGSESRPPSRNAHERLRSRQASADRGQQPRPVSLRLEEAVALQPLHNDAENQPSKPVLEQKLPQRIPSLRAGQFRYAPLAPKVRTDASEDQENVPPPTFKRNKDQELKHLGKPSIAILSDEEQVQPRQTEETPVPIPAQQQGQRKVLGAISGNTPHRAAPAPPPKMSVIDTATTTAGASVTKSKKKRSHIVVNGKIFTQMGRIGSGGSSHVYCVMAENYKTFALKRVRLDNCDESAVRGYKGEIDLLKKLTEVERVVRLFDWELNDEKQELLVLMEKGDTDLSRLLTLRLNGDKAKFDPVFTRYYWREMLECVQAVHDEEIVHSDLKPANFLLVQGRLKLIDFGIANAIDIDNTVNVHRDTHVGTPNYMSPESITDTNAPAPGMSTSSRDAPVKKDMKIGKASDLWSLGCILYQMTYGKPPFAHIPNQLSRIMAITNPHHAIVFPENGVGGAPIPPSLRGCLRRCLNRDPDQRPTVATLLSPEDPYMNPERDGVVILDENLLGQILGKVVERCRDPKRGIPSDSEIKAYPRSFMERVWSIQEQA